MKNVAQDDDLAAVRERVAAAQRALEAAYNTRDSLAEEVAAAESAPGGAVRAELLVALSAAERAVLAAEAGMKDAEYALAIAADGPDGRGP